MTLKVGGCKAGVESLFYLLPSYLLSVSCITIVEGAATSLSDDHNAFSDSTISTNHVHLYITFHSKKSNYFDYNYES